MECWERVNGIMVCGGANAPEAPALAMASREFSKVRDPRIKLWVIMIDLV